MSGIAENKCEESGIRRRPKQEGYDRYRWVWMGRGLNAKASQVHRGR